MNSDPLYLNYKKVRNRIRQFSPKSVIGHLVDALFKVEAAGPDSLRSYQPWNILLAIKWTLQEADPVAYRRRPASLNDVHRVLNGIHEMEGAGPLPSELGDVILFIRRIAYQQFWIHSFDGSALARQEIMFGRLPGNHTFQRQFLETTGISICDFLDLSYSLLALVLVDKPLRAFRRQDFVKLEVNVSPGTVDRFLRHLSRTAAELHVWLNEPGVKNVRIADQLVLPSPFFQAPLLAEDDVYKIYFPRLLYRSLEGSIYSTLRRPNAELFMQKFGGVFQAYLDRCLVDGGVTFTPEHALLKKLPGSGKCVDFLVQEDDCDILIDAKGVEISTLGRVSYDPTTVYQAIKVSGVKAIIQGMDTARRLKSVRAESQRETFLLVVTFEHLNLGSSVRMSQSLGKIINPILDREYGKDLPLPLENVFFLTVAEFEQMIEMVRIKATTILQAILTAKKNNGAGETTKLHFGQHLDSISRVSSRLPLLEAALDRIEARCFAKLSG